MNGRQSRQAVRRRSGGEELAQGQAEALKTLRVADPQIDAGNDRWISIGRQLAVRTRSKRDDGRFLTLEA